MTTIVTRSGKGSPLTHTEVDTNFTNLNTAKLETAAIPLGTLQAPSVSFLNDSDTGIFCPQGGNSLAIATGGQYAITCSSTQAVGIKTANPQGALQVAGSTRIGANDATDAFLEIGEGATGNRNSYIDIVADTTYTDYGLRVIRNNTGANATSELKHRGTGALNFTTEEAAPIVFYTTNSPALTITSGGLVGIGTGSPAFAVDISAPSDAIVRSRTNGNTSAGFIGSTNNGTNNWFLGSRKDSVGGSSGTDRFNLLYDTSTYLTVTTAGNVGIGTTSPSSKLHVSETFSSSTIPLRVYGSATGTGGGLYDVAHFLSDDATTVRISEYNAGASSITGELTLSAGDGNVQVVGSTGPLVFKTNVANGTGGYGTTGEKARLTADGKFLVGTDTTSANATALFAGNPSGNYTSLYLSAKTTSFGTNDNFANIHFTDSGHTVAASIQCGRDGGTWTSGSSQPTKLVFSTTPDSGSSPTERMRITNSGFAKFTNSGSYHHAVTTSRYEFRSNQNDVTFNIVNANASPTAAALGCNIFYTAASPNNTGCEFLYCEDSTTLRASIRSNGGLANYSTNNANLSDRNVKKDIALAAGTWDCIKEWEIVNYRYKDQSDDADLNLGVIAQQVAESCPEVITIFQEAKEATEDKPAQEERLGVKEQQMYWMAIKALQEAMGRIEALETEVALLKAA